MLERSSTCPYCSAADRRRYRRDGAWLHGYDFWIFSFLLPEYFPRGFYMYLSQPGKWIHISAQRLPFLEAGSYTIDVPSCPDEDFPMELVSLGACAIWYNRHHFRLLEQKHLVVGTSVTSPLCRSFFNADVFIDGFSLAQPGDPHSAVVHGGSQREPTLQAFVPGLLAHILQGCAHPTIIADVAACCRGFCDLDQGSCKGNRCCTQEGHQ